MSITDKLSSALALIDSYNSQVDKSDQIDKDEFTRKLKKIGGTTEDLLAEMKWEDLQQAGLPVLLARKVATIFRTAKKEDPNFVSEKAAQRMPPVYLLQSYDPQDPNSAVSKRLRDLSGGKRFIVFKADGKANVEVSARMLQEVMKGFPERITVDVDGKPTKLYAVGQGLGELVDENPLYQGRALRPDGTCDQINRSWDGVSPVVRQLIHVAVYNTKEAVENGMLTLDKAHFLRDMAEGDDAEKRIRSRYPKSSVALDEMAAEGKSPVLKVKIGAAGSRGNRNDPFYQHKEF